MEDVKNTMLMPISGTEMGAVIPNVMKYGELKRMTSLPPLPAAILYETEPDFGHWTGIFRTPEGIEFFDSYGYAPDIQLNWVPKRFRMFSGQEEKRLLRMLYNSGIDINFNNHRLQRRRGPDAPMTCGRWVLLRSMFADTLGCDQFAHMVTTVAKKLHVTPDELVSMVIK